ncbi:c-type cytochrome [Candidatus Binatia bacterium]|nr:c-type cytochrome [Candidatus Binatia bacterium]
MQRASRAPLLVALLIVASAGPARALVPRGDASGALLYQRECAPCHGAAGRGDGPEGIYFAPPPRDLREGFLTLYPTEELAEKIRRGRELRIEIDPAATRRRTRMVEAIVAHLERLPDVTWPPVERGAALYAARCEACHGPFGTPAPGMRLPPGVQRPPRDLASPEFQKAVSDAELLEVVRHGRAGMPAIPPLASDAEAHDLVAYVRLLSPGFAYYSLWCGGCHGDDGKGDGVFARGADAPPVVLDRGYLRAQDPEELRRNVLHMLERQDAAMPHFERQLTEKQAREIVEYLRAAGPLPAPSPPAR